MATPADNQTSECAYVLGDDGLATWSDAHADAWIGLLETHKRLTRALDAELEAEHGLSLSGGFVRLVIHLSSPFRRSVHARRDCDARRRQAADLPRSARD